MNASDSLYLITLGDAWRPPKCLVQVNVLDSARETLILLGVIVLQTDLDFHCLQETALLVLGCLEYGIDALIERITRYFRPKMTKNY